MNARVVLMHILLYTTLLNAVTWAWYSDPHMFTGHTVMEHSASTDNESWDGGPYGKNHFCTQGICHLIGHLIGFVLTQTIPPGVPLDAPAPLSQSRLIAADLPPPFKPPRA